MTESRLMTHTALVSALDIITLNMEIDEWLENHQIPEINVKSISITNNDDNIGSQTIWYGLITYEERSK